VTRLGNAGDMRSPVLRWTLVLVLIAVGLAASTALFVDYTKPSPVFCAEGGGCDALKHTVFAHPLGLPLPIFGVAGFVVLGALAFGRGPRVRKVNLILAGAGGVFGLGLLALQWLLGELCSYCTAVDTSVLVLGLLAWNRMRREWDPPPGRLVTSGAAFALSLAVGVPLVWGKLHKTPIPEVIAEELAQTPPGKITVVDFVDFECPFCRLAQTTVGPLLASRKDQVRLVRKMVPLTRIHSHALAAAKAACCAEVLGKGDAMADALFAAPVEALTTDGCAALAESLGLPLDRYRACLDDPATDARIEHDKHEFERAAAKGDGLPLMWIGPQKIMGAQEADTFARALSDAASGAGL